MKIIKFAVTGVLAGVMAAGTLMAVAMGVFLSRELRNPQSFGGWR